MTFFSVCIHFFNSCKSWKDLLTNRGEACDVAIKVQSMREGERILGLKNKSWLSGDEAPPSWELLYVQSEYG